MTDEKGEAFTVERSHRGSAAPTAPFTDAGGKAMTLAAFAGKPVLVNFWATWCAPCVKEMPTLDRLAAANQRIAVAAISQDLDGAASGTPFFAKHKLMALKPYYDMDNALLTALGMQGLPTTVLYDAKGREVWRVQGSLDWSRQTAAKLIAEAG